MIISGTPITNRELIFIIQKSFHEGPIRNTFNFQFDTSTTDRLDAFFKQNCFFDNQVRENKHLIQKLHISKYEVRLYMTSISG